MVSDQVHFRSCIDNYDDDDDIDNYDDGDSDDDYYHDYDDVNTYTLQL